MWRCRLAGALAPSCSSGSSQSCAASRRPRSSMIAAEFSRGRSRKRVYAGISSCSRRYWGTDMTAVLKQITAIGFGLAAWVAPATAVPVVYTSPTAFSSANPSVVAFAQSYPAGTTSKTPSFSNGPVTFTSAGLNAYNDVVYGAGVSYIGAYSANTLTITSASDAFGFNFGSYAGAQIVSFLVNDIPGTFALGSHGTTSFLGFSSGGGPITVSFKQAAELDVVGSFVANTAIAAVPEPMTWMTLLLGFGVAGTSIRVRRGIAASAQSRSGDAALHPACGC